MSIHSDVNIESKIEILTIKLQIRKLKSIVISCIYRPKFNVSKSDLCELENIFNALIECRLKFYACGDYNLHLEDFGNSQIKKFNSLLNRLYLKELINAPTRGTAQLDLIVSNDLELVTDSSVICSMSDHDAIFIIRRSKPKRPKKLISCRKFSNINWDLFGHECFR